MAEGGDSVEELSYVESSLRDLEAERAAGDVSERDYARLRRRYDERRRVLLLKGASAPAESASTAPRPRAGRLAKRLASRRARLVTGWSALACFLAAATLVILDIVAAGPFASPSPLPVGARVRIMLAEAADLGSNGEVTEALATYDRVLALRPRQPEALTEGGWLARLAGIAEHEPALVRNGDAEVEAAVAAAPRSAVARAYDAVLLLEDRHEPRQAVIEFRAMLADHPSEALLRRVRTVAKVAYADSHLALPPQLRS